MSVNSGRPLVSVPVLSTATTWASRRVCKASPLRNSTPNSAARPVPTMMEVGVASPMAQGQAMISTATALTSAKVSAGSGPKTSQTTKVRAAAAITAGTNHMVTRSTMAWIGSLEPCADSTMRTIWASTVSAPTAVARKRKEPVLFTVPPTTDAPASFRTGTGSPVTMLSSTKEAPSSTSPSTGSRSPGRINTTSPAPTSATGSSTAWPPRSTRAVLAWRPIRRLIASEVRPLLRASRKRPSRMSVTMTADAS